MNKRRIVIVGAKFGELYLNHFIDPQPGLELAGVLSTGSARSASLATAFGVPLYTSAEMLPDDIDVACVVIRAANIGGPGNALTEQLIRKGIHVIQEHPVSPHELQRHLRLAREHSVQYRVNSFYATTPAAAKFISAAIQVSAQFPDQPSDGSFVTSRQLLYSALDILLQAIDCRESVSVELLGRLSRFDIFSLKTGSTELLLRLQNYLDPDDPDMHSLVMHQITLGWPAGYLTLNDSYGPVCWSPVLYADNHLDSSSGMYQSSGTENSYQDKHASIILHRPADCVRECIEVQGPEGVGRVLSQFCALLEGETGCGGLDTAHQIRVAELWEQILRLAGEPHQRSVCAAEWIHMEEEQCL
ncbi:Gfo/Idh/MocA family oxidoreductase [Aliamphritea hakodatensis]|uniref:Gfo/Idh/MocA family oxidoreductase n=1 Tax=Aliamphritea hakodatensis TaxID=2895352 RepID=UPI0022FD5BCF|nr:Gfo/Idh/MocA family oxidoreductase [Aliamphritea hakodatensis]